MIGLVKYNIGIGPRRMFLLPPYIVRFTSSGVHAFPRRVKKRVIAFVYPILYSLRVQLLNVRVKYRLGPIFFSNLAC